MTSERVQRQIDRLLDEAEAAVAASDWDRVKDRVRNVLAFAPENQDALTYLAAAERAGVTVVPVASSAPSSPPPSPTPTSFVNGRYEVKRFLGEGGKKKVYLARDTLLDRDVAFALIKTEGLDEVGKERRSEERR